MDTKKNIKYQPVMYDEPHAQVSGHWISWNASRPSGLDAVLLLRGGTGLLVSERKRQPTLVCQSASRIDREGKGGGGLRTLGRGSQL